MANEEHLAILSQGVGVWNAWRAAHPEIRPNLRSADLHSTFLRDANLAHANLTHANLARAILTHATLTHANLAAADLAAADLTAADLTAAVLADAILDQADLTNADLTNAKLGHTILTNLDLSQVRGLETVRHWGPSSIGIDTFYISQGKIPESFLRGAGIPASFIEALPSLIGKPTQER
jgi:uncharacterized protein YjbI with pentapeptide repeats